MYPFRKYYSPRFVGSVFLVLVFVTVCLYYGSYTGVINIATPTTGFNGQISVTQPRSSFLKSSKEYETKYTEGTRSESWTEADSEINEDTCPIIYASRTNVNTVEEFSKFEFQPFWLKSREYWDESFEERYKQKKRQWPRLPLKVIIVPHSHNDPGWLKTFEGYYHSQTRNILNHMVDKLQLLKNMTFIWSEISFLSQWWDSAHLTKKRVVQQMLEEGRLEIVTGGWVMTDEATSHIYAMLDQLIEGHQWIKNNLGITVNSGWSVDPFGHGPTVPYLLKSSGVVSGAVIQRIHYSWKQWFAKHMMGDFMWRQSWDSLGYTDMFVHNQPFDIYSIKHSCGPHPQICTYYDFRKVAGEYSEHSLRAMPIDQQNVKQKADVLMEQYERTGSLYPHNVILVPLGDDFRYDQDVEWEQQYRNYKRLMDYVNGHKEVYHAEIMFGTPIDYFKEVQSRMSDFPTLNGDFFVYSDIFTEGRPAYWSGYFTTRPYWKLLDRELERNLRSAEILYTFGLNKAKQRRHNDTIKVIERNYEKLVKARQNLALFQHHDAITGTSKAFVMRDYALKLIEGIQDSVFLQTYIVQNLLLQNGNSELPSYRIIVPESDTESYDTTSPKIVTTVTKQRKIVIFNSHAQHRQEVVKMQVNTPNLTITDYQDNVILHQINPVWNISANRASSYESQPIEILKNRFELLFIVDLAPLSVNVFTLTAQAADTAASTAIVYCQHCQQNQHVFQTKNIQLGDIQLENRKVRALFDGKSGFLKTITKKETEKRIFCEMTIAAYQSAQFHSGAYLFMPDPNSHDTERDVLRDYPHHFIIITSGPIASELTVVYDDILTHSARLYHKEGPLGEGIYMENVIDFGVPPRNRETEMYMRFASGINNGNPSQFYTDSNGMQMQKRLTVGRIGIEGNYFPITTSAYIEDEEHRLTLLVDHSQGASSWQPGFLEVMLDRRTLYDDARGMGEGIVDNKKILTKYWLLLEDIVHPRPSEVSRPSLLSNYLSNGLLYPANLFLVEESTGVPDHPSVKRSELFNSINAPVHLISKPLPCDVTLLNFRTLTDSTFTQFPSTSALMVLHRQGFACNVSPKATIPNCHLESISSHKHAAFRPNTRFADMRIKSLAQTSLTGLHRLKIYNTFDEVTHVPMNLLTLNVTFDV